MSHDPDYFAIQGVKGNPLVFSWDEFLDLYLVEYNSWCAAGRQTSREQLDHFFQAFGKEPRHEWVIRMPIIKKVVPNNAHVIPNCDDGIKQCENLGLKLRAILYASEEMLFGTDDPEVHEKLFILKLCF